MVALVKGSVEMSNLFQLFGDKEDDITSSLAWVMYRCPSLLVAFVTDVTGVRVHTGDCSDAIIRNQSAEGDCGRTDIEIEVPSARVHLIVEAKRGWNPPGITQLEKYAARPSFRAANRYLVSLSACPDACALRRIGASRIGGIPVSYCSYRHLKRLVDRSYPPANNRQKDVLSQFSAYLEKIMTLQNTESNMVYVVSLSRNHPGESQLSFIDIVEKKNRYFHPIKSRWPSNPPNYVAFRYGGRLRSIRHVDSYVITENLHSEIPELDNKIEDDLHYVYGLGPVIIPPKVVKAGKITRSTRIWAMIDTLLACDTISEARDLTRSRQQCDETG